MKVSTKVEYGLIAIIDIALNSKNDESVNSAQIAERQGISKKFLEQIMNSLRIARLVTALKGAKGGYKLVKPPKEITLAEILNALDISILAEHTSNFSQDSNIIQLLDDDVWKKLNDSIITVAESITLADLVDEYNDKFSLDDLMYYI
jgi:Rrf2 family protein